MLSEISGFNREALRPTETFVTNLPVQVQDVDILKPKPPGLLAELRTFQADSLKPTETVVRTMPTVKSEIVPGSAEKTENRFLEGRPEEIHGFRYKLSWAPPKLAVACDIDARPGYQVCPHLHPSSVSHLHRYQYQFMNRFLN